MKIVPLQTAIGFLFLWPVSALSQGFEPVGSAAYYESTDYGLSVFSTAASTTYNQIPVPGAGSKVKSRILYPGGPGIQAPEPIDGFLPWDFAFSIPGKIETQGQPAIASDGEGFLVAYQARVQWTSGGVQHQRTAILAGYFRLGFWYGDSAYSPPRAFQISNVDPAKDYYLPSVAYHAGAKRFAIIYHEKNQFGTTLRLGFINKNSSPSSIPVDYTPSNQIQSTTLSASLAGASRKAIVPTFGGYYVMWTANTVGDSRVFGNAFMTNGTNNIGNERSVMSTNPNGLYFSEGGQGISRVFANRERYATVVTYNQPGANPGQRPGLICFEYNGSNFFAAAAGAFDEGSGGGVALASNHPSNAYGTAVWVRAAGSRSVATARVTLTDTSCGVDLASVQLVEDDSTCSESSPSAVALPKEGETDLLVWGSCFKSSRQASAKTIRTVSYPTFESYLSR